MRNILALVIGILILSVGGGVFGAYFYTTHLQPSTNKATHANPNQAQPMVAAYAQPQSAPQSPAQTTARHYAAAELPNGFVKASQTSTPSVVYIKTTTGGQATTWFDYFFRGYQGQNVSTGSGVILTKDGYIVTNNHVIDGAEQIEVIHQKRIHQAKLVGTDPSTDIALLKIEGNDLPAIPVGKSKEVEVGQWVLAVGNPFNLTSTVTAGIVSARGRNLNLLASEFPIESFIQTDAAINPGNSGGALVNIHGELIGINTAIYSKTGSYAGYGFAVPSDIVLKVVNDLIKYGMVQKVFTGLEAQNVTERIANKLGTNNLSGVVVTYIQAGGAADNAGLQIGDVVTNINNEPISNKGDFDEVLSYYYPGDKISLTYRRDNKQKTVQLVLTNQEGTVNFIERKIFASTLLGADLERVPKVEKDKLGIDAGVRILKVKRGIISRMGLPEGFIVIGVNQTQTQTPEDLELALQKARGRTIVQGITPNGQKQYYSFWF